MKFWNLISTSWYDRIWKGTSGFWLSKVYGKHFKNFSKKVIALCSNTLKIIEKCLRKIAKLEFMAYKVNNFLVKLFDNKESLLLENSELDLKKFGF